jgi:hypothetical protein
VVVTIGGTTPANVFTNVPNYTGSGGNGKTRGVFAGAGATTQSLGGQPPFVSAATRTATSSTRKNASIIRVADSSQLGALLNNATVGLDGKVRVSPHGRSRNASAQASTGMTAAKTELHRSADARARSGASAFRLQ